MLFAATSSLTSTQKTDIMWQDYCLRTSDTRCIVATPTPTVTPKPTASPTPIATPVPTPTPIVTPTPSGALGQIRPYDNTSPWNTLIGDAPTIDTKSSAYVTA